MRVEGQGEREAAIIDKLGLTTIEVWVDPATSGKGDRTGICVVGGDDRHRWPDQRRRAYVLEDATELLGVEQWAAKTAQVAKRWGTVRIGGERNRMGDAVKVIMKSVVPDALFIGVDAIVSKPMRADPVKSAHAQGLVIFVGHHPLLEADMCQWVPADGSDPELTPEEVLVAEEDAHIGSPDALDAMVHGVRNILGLGQERGTTMAGVGSIMDSAWGG